MKNYAKTKPSINLQATAGKIVPQNNHLILFKQKFRAFSFNEPSRGRR